MLSQICYTYTQCIGMLESALSWAGIGQWSNEIKMLAKFNITGHARIFVLLLWINELQSALIEDRNFLGIHNILEVHGVSCIMYILK